MGPATEEAMIIRDGQRWPDAGCPAVTSEEQAGRVRQTVPQSGGRKASVECDERASAGVQRGPGASWARVSSSRAETASDKTRSSSCTESPRQAPGARGYRPGPMPPPRVGPSSLDLRLAPRQLVWHHNLRSTALPARILCFSQIAGSSYAQSQRQCCLFTPSPAPQSVPTKTR